MTFDQEKKVETYQELRHKVFNEIHKSVNKKCRWMTFKHENTRFLEYLAIDIADNVENIESPRAEDFHAVVMANGDLYVNWNVLEK